MGKSQPKFYRHHKQKSRVETMHKGVELSRNVQSENTQNLGIVTNLWDNEFSADDIKKIYKMRWCIETSFRELKYHIGLISFHSKKKDCVIQEIFASLIMYNFSMLITENILIDDDKRNKYRSRVNHAVAIHICIAFFRCSNVSPSHLEKLIARNKCSVRHNRNAVRKTRYHSAIPFNYRLS